MGIYFFVALVDEGGVDFVVCAEIRKRSVLTLDSLYLLYVVLN